MTAFVDRPNLTGSVVADAVADLVGAIDRRLARKGRGAYAGPHEAYGVVAEEVDDLLEAVRTDDLELVEAEALDVAVACVVAVASLRMRRHRKGAKP